jgi:hypothetical protein
MIIDFFSIIGTAWTFYNNLGKIKKFFKIFGLTKDYIQLKIKNPEVFLSLEKIYFVENLSEELMEKLGDKILTDIETSNGIEAGKNKISFELSKSHINFSIEHKKISIPGEKQLLVILKTDTKLYYPFNQKSILKKLQNDFYEMSELISSVYNFDKSNEVINLELNIEGMNKEDKFTYLIDKAEVIYKNKKLQINTTHLGDNYPLIIASILLWNLRFPDVKFLKTKNQIVE